jgi:lipopolysaccharide/colanic/teichoic acid biosynthesis glycosyltransferase
MQSGSANALAGTTDHSFLYIDQIRVDRSFQHRVSVSRTFRLQLRLKRLFDIVVSGFLLVFISPVLITALLLIRISSPGPSIFSQRRWGHNERQFRMFKIRTMYVDQAAKLGREQSEVEKRKGILLKMKDDPRVTPIGAFLRRSSIDELPQLFNVLIGDMSIVGPRPLMIHMMEPFPEIRAVRSVVRPGLTGLWQIRNRANNTSVTDMIADDTEYIANIGLLLDLRILLATPWELIRGTGAH